MGCGKTTIGKKLAKKLSYNFIDLDKEIENHEQILIEQIFETKGEAYFRKIEHEKLLEVVQRKNLVVACGGGTPCFFDNMKIINNNGISIYIQMNSEALFSRLKQAKTKRPLIKNLNEEELQQYIKHKLMERESFYVSSKYIVDGLNIDIKSLSESILKQDVN